VAGNIIAAWVMTIPAAAIVGGGIYALSTVFGDDSAIGPVIVAVIGLTLSAWAFARRLRRGPTLTTAEE
jgi:hypothetical protein